MSEPTLHGYTETLLVQRNPDMNDMWRTHVDHRSDSTVLSVAGCTVMPECGYGHRRRKGRRGQRDDGPN